MAHKNIYAHFKDTPPVDDLCPQCFNPSLKMYHFERLDMTGITVLGTRIACTDCKIWIGPLRPMETHAHDR